MKRNKLPTKVQEQQLRKPNSQVEVTEQGKNLKSNNRKISR